jgi:hypothetical protein
MPADIPVPGPAENLPDRTRAWLLVAASVVAVAAFATWNSIHKSMWVDESYSMYTARLPFEQTVRRSLSYEYQPPLYFALLNLWLHIRNSLLFGRALSTLAMMAFIAVMAAIARRFGVRRWPLVACGVACIPAVVWAAAELRGYALLMLLSALTWYFFLEVSSPGREPRRSTQAGYVLSAAALMLCFYYGAFVLFGQWLVAGLTRRQWLRITVLLAIAALALVPLLPLISWQMASHPLESEHLHFLEHPLHGVSVVVATIGESITARAPLIERPPVVALLVAVGLLVFVARLRAGRRQWGSIDLMVTVGAIVPVLFIATVQLGDVATVFPRHYVVALPGLVIAGIVWLAAVGSARIRWITLGVLGSVLIGSIISFQRNDRDPEEWRGAAAYVSAHAAPGDIVLLFDPDKTLPFNFYYHGPARDYGLPTDIDLSEYKPSTYGLYDTAQIAARLRVIGDSTPQRPPIWLLMTPLWPPARDTTLKLINRYLQAHYDTVEHLTQFNSIALLHAHDR